MSFPQTHNQCVYLRSLQSPKPIVIVTGPAGTGKTMLACQEAVRFLGKRKYDQVIFTRPIVPVGEDIGYLPGDVEEKMHPWSYPFFENCAVKHRVSVEPLGFMRGRTFRDTFIIADEMQNSSPAQMKMLLTRVGENTKIVVMGDDDQSDIDGTNGLTELMNRVEGLDLAYVDHVSLGLEDIKRHPSVSEILSVYRI